jgi:flagellar protein FlbD
VNSGTGRPAEKGGPPGGVHPPSAVHDNKENDVMIQLTKLHGEKIVVNADLVEFVEATPDTIISTTSGKKMMVKESVDEVVKLVIEYRRKCLLVGKKR